MHDKDVDDDARSHAEQPPLVKRRPVDPDLRAALAPDPEMKTKANVVGNCAKFCSISCCEKGDILHEETCRIAAILNIDPGRTR